jgi:simple sugar transport system ATP-binding protein
MSEDLGASEEKPRNIAEPMVVMRGITKAFPMVMANDQIDFDIYPAEIHALLGENGAGKSTLVKILYGFYKADEGQIIFKGQPVQIRSPYDAKQLHMGMVFQDFSLIPAFSIIENIALFLPDLKPVINARQIAGRIDELSQRYELEIDPQALVSDLSIGELQKVEILKLLLSEACLLILDEPTRVLAPHEKEALFRVLDNLRADGYAIILITHKLREVLDAADRITVLRDGRVAGTLPRADASEDKLVSLMFERRLPSLKLDRTAALEAGRLPLLELCGVTTRGEGLQPILQDIDLKIYPGEIVGVAGVSGNGQRELGDVTLGMIPCAQGARILHGKDMTRASIRQIRRAGVSLIPENPLAMAAAPFLSVLENMAIPKAVRYARYGGLRIDWPAVQRDAEHSMQALGFSLPLRVPARSLSGGNLQRMVIVRELAHDPKLIIASYLTRGLDVKSTIAARQSLVQARDQGAGVLLVSEDLEELFALSDRLIVLYDGKIVGRFTPSETSFQEVGFLMTGSRSADALEG